MKGVILEFVNGVFVMKWPAGTEQCSNGITLRSIALAVSKIKGCLQDLDALLGV